MNSSISVVLTDTSIAILSKNTVLTSIPLRHWTSSNGSTWSGRLRPQTEVIWLIDRLSAVLRDDGHESVMKKVSHVMSEVLSLPTNEPNPGVEVKLKPAKARKIVRTVRKPA